MVWVKKKERKLNGGEKARKTLTSAGDSVPGITGSAGTGVAPDRVRAYGRSSRALIP